MESKDYEEINTSLNVLYKKYLDLLVSTRDYSADLLKFVITISGALIVLFPPVTGLTFDSNPYYILAQILSMGCILFGSIALYILLRENRILCNDVREEIKKSLVEKRQPEAVRGKFRLLSVILESICFGCFIISLLIIFINNIAN